MYAARFITGMACWRGLYTSCGSLALSHGTTSAVGLPASLNELTPFVMCTFAAHLQVLLSCSHVFHTQCLASFEQYARVRACPLCRKQWYQKLIINDAAEAYRHECATRCSISDHVLLDPMCSLQAVFRVCLDYDKLASSHANNFSGCFLCTAPITLLMQ